MADRVQIGLAVQGMTCDGCASEVEGLRLAALAFDRDVSKLSCCAT